MPPRAATVPEERLGAALGASVSAFVDRVKGGVIPNEYIPAIEKGVIKAMENGPCGGFPVVDVKCTVYFGSYHEVDSNEFAFIECARQCFKNLFLKGNPQLLEPIMSVEVAVPEDYMGAATGSICGRRGRVEGMEQPAGDQSKSSTERNVRLLELDPYDDPRSRNLHHGVRTL